MTRFTGRGSALVAAVVGAELVLEPEQPAARTSRTIQGTARRATREVSRSSGERKLNEGRPRYHESMAVTAPTTKLDARKLRADFPIFEQTFHGKPLAFLDSAASSQKPRQMLDGMREFYETSYANVHRGVYQLAERATAALEGSREKVRERPRVSISSPTRGA